jgi:SUN domain-containing protein 1/2
LDKIKLQFRIDLDTTRQDLERTLRTLGEKDVKQLGEKIAQLNSKFSSTESSSDRIGEQIKSIEARLAKSSETTATRIGKQLKELQDKIASEGSRVSNSEIKSNKLLQQLKSLEDKLKHETSRITSSEEEANKLVQQLQTLEERLKEAASVKQSKHDADIKQVLDKIDSSERSVLAKAETKFKELLKSEKVDHNIDEIVAQAVSNALTQVTNKLEQLDTKLKQKENVKTTVSEGVSAELKQVLTEDIMEKVKAYVKENLDAYYFGDYLNKTDHALKTMGAVIMDSSNNYEWKKTSWLQFPSGWHEYLFNKDGASKPPETLLDSDNSVGNCWAFAGSRGHVAILVPNLIVPESFSIDHISKSLAPDFSSAPRTFSVYGYKNVDDQKGDLLGKFEYQANSDVVQNFKLERFIQPTQEENNAQETRVTLHDPTNPLRSGFRIFNFNFETNHGNKDYTCVYRVRIHGRRV